MKNTLFCLSLLFAGFFFINAYTKSEHPTMVKEKLSDYAFFTGKLADMQPAEGVVPYQLNTPLFSDYAFKARFVCLPKGTKATYNATQVFDFPIGTYIIKTFYYPKNFAKPQGEKTIIETRLLIHEEK